MLNYKLSSRLSKHIGGNPSRSNSKGKGILLGGQTQTRSIIVKASVLKDKVILINTEPSLGSRLFRGSGLFGRNLLLTLKNRKVDESTLSEFERKQLVEAKVDFIYTIWAASALSCNDPFLLLSWLAGSVFFPQYCVPRVFRTATEKEVCDFIVGTLESFDEQKDGFAPIKIAKDVLEIVDPTLTEDEIDRIMLSVRMTEDGHHVNYVDLADFMVRESE